MKWFSDTPEALLEQETLLAVLKYAGYDLARLQAEVNTSDKLFSVVWDSAIKAHNGNIPFSKHAVFGPVERNTAKNFARKCVGTMGEYLLDGIVNSNQQGKLVPPNWIRSVHRSEYGVPDLDMGSPDRVILDIAGNPFTFASVKFYAPFSKKWEMEANLPNSYYWMSESKKDYPALIGVNSIGLFTNQSKPKIVKFSGGMITGDMLRQHIDVTNAGQTSNQFFWNDFWRELEANVTAGKLLVRTEKIGKSRRPDNFQTTMFIDKLGPVGPQTLVGGCGIGKMVLQTSLIPRTRSINLVTSGIRLVLASQMYRSMKRDIELPFHCLHVMSGQDYHKEYDEFSDVTNQQHTTNANEIAVTMIKYTQCKDDNLPLHILTIEQSLNKVVKAFQMIENATVIDPEKGEPFWDNGSKNHMYWREKIFSLCTEAIYDEAHNLVSGDPVKGSGVSSEDKEDKRKTSYLTDLIFLNTVFTRSTYWTATRRLNGSKRDMANEKMFGKVVACVIPSLAIKGGYAVRPKVIPYSITDDDIAAVETSTNLGDLKEDSLEITYYIKCLEHALADCTERGLPCQIMVFVDDSSKQEKFAEIVTKYFNADGLVADVVRADTPQREREKIFTRFSSSKFSVLFNYAIVHEGVDIDSCTGVILGRVLNEIWLVQAIGRSQRLLKEDREQRFGDINNYRKQYGLVYSLVDQTSAASDTYWNSLKDIFWKITQATNDADWLDFSVGGTTSYPRGTTDDEIANGQPMTVLDNTMNSDELKERLKIYHDEMVERLNAEMEATAKLNTELAEERDDTLDILQEMGIEL
jgi:hypothetical protein